MNFDEQLIEIAKVCGWEVADDRGLAKKDGITAFLPHSKLAQTRRDMRLPPGRQVPDYPHDLEAMREAENYLHGADPAIYATYLLNVCGATYQRPFPAIHATAEQKAEAFLKALRIWKL